MDDRNEYGALAVFLSLLSLVAIVAMVVPPSRSTAPTPGECVESWNAPDNAATRRAIAGIAHRGAVVRGSVAQEAYGYCHVALRQKRWRMYTGVEFGHEAPPGFHQAAEPVIDTSLNATVHADGTIELGSPPPPA